VDALGPLFNHKVEYNYCLVFLDHTSRFPHAVALRNLTAKRCCEAMLSLWQFTGFPTKVTSDNAGNFTRELTREFLRRLGCSPRAGKLNVPADTLSRSGSGALNQSMGVE